MGLLQRSRRARSARQREAALQQLQDAAARLGHAVARLARVSQDWSAAQASLALSAAASSEPVSRVLHSGEHLASTVAASAREAQHGVASTARTVRKRGLRLFDLGLVVALVLLRRRLQRTRAAHGSDTAPPAPQAQSA